MTAVYHRAVGSTGRLMLLVALLLATGQTVALADGLADVREALSRLDGREPIRASVEVAVVVRKQDGGVPVGRHAVTLRAVDGPTGLTLDYPRAQLEQAAVEARKLRSDPATPTPTDAILRDDVDALAIAAVLNVAGPLAYLLEGGTVLEDGPDERAGQPVRRIRVQVDPPLSSVDRKYLKEIDMTLVLWLGSDGQPVAAESRLELKVGILFLNLKSREHEHWELQRVGDRLLATRHQKDTSASGLGRELLDRTVTTVVRVE